MIVNSSLTVYHKGFDKDMLETWTRFNYSNVWVHGGHGAGISKGYENANDVEIRIPYGQNTGLDIRNFSIGDIVVPSTLSTDITKQQDLKNVDFYNITSITDNTFGNSKHIHLGGK